MSYQRKIEAYSAQNSFRRILSFSSFSRSFHFLYRQKSTGKSFPLFTLISKNGSHINAENLQIISGNKLHNTEIPIGIKKSAKMPNEINAVWKSMKNFSGGRGKNEGGNIFNRRYQLAKCFEVQVMHLFLRNERTGHSQKKTGIRTLQLGNGQRKKPGKWWTKIV